MLSSTFQVLSTLSIPAVSGLSFLRSRPDSFLEKAWCKAVLCLLSSLMSQGGEPGPVCGFCPASHPSSPDPKKLGLEDPRGLQDRPWPPDSTQREKKGPLRSLSVFETGMCREPWAPGGARSSMFGQKCPTNASQYVWFDVASSILETTRALKGDTWTISSWQIRGQPFPKLPSTFIFPSFILNLLTLNLVEFWEALKQLWARC